MSLINYFRKNKKTAAEAKDRLQIIIAQQRTQKGSPDFLPLLRQDIMAAIAKHTQVDINKVQVDLQCRDNDSVLELNVILPDISNTSDKKQKVAEPA